MMQCQMSHSLHNWVAQFWMIKDNIFKSVLIFSQDVHLHFNIVATYPSFKGSMYVQLLTELDTILCWHVESHVYVFRDIIIDTRKKYSKPSYFVSIAVRGTSTSVNSDSYTAPGITALRGTSSWPLSSPAPRSSQGHGQRPAGHSGRAARSAARGSRHCAAERGAPACPASAAATRRTKEPFLKEGFFKGRCPAPEFRDLRCWFPSPWNFRCRRQRSLDTGLCPACLPP